ncbi:helix-turn-helix domain-containing protein [Lacipirellula parvula]|uniref:HTH araC/xylS-type domain-containing protein n=1 Tax=Lacipirellula parvula TaxID=2650471 RepID=A0A5K7X379_9BACT|nr:AraC family transcriptional regulator [Lacipirellula parvula]BBO30815.1 hypothetical protein PLANPX_0427 [Lacipirellula parvula]
MAELESFFRYFPVDDDLLRCGAYVTGAGAATILPGAPYPPFGHPALYHFDWRRGRTLPEFQMVLVAQGAGEFESELTPAVRFTGPTLLWLFPGVWHRYRPVQSVGWNERWFSYNGELVHRLWTQGMIDPVRAVAPLDAKSTLVGKFEMQLEQIRTNAMSQTALYSLQVLRLVAEAIEAVAAANDATVAGSSPSQRFEDSVVVDALRIIRTRSHRAISIDDVAEELAVARRTLDRRFAAATGRSILEEINDCRLNRAKRLLAETDLSLRSIANQVGFSSPERMGLLFGRREGMSPSEFRSRRTRHGSAVAASRQPRSAQPSR